MRKLLFIFFLAALAAYGAWVAVAKPKLTPVERGRRLAEANGCFSCHGPEGTRGVANPGRPARTVPSYRSLMMYADDREQTLEWIRDGVTSARAKSQSWRAERDLGALRMPAYGKKLSARQIDDLVSFAMAVAAEPAPGDSLALRGRDLAAELGCVGCHGEGGRFARPNPGSLKGYVPPWDGPDFAELVQNRGEFGEWIERGVSRRFLANPVAQFFLDRGTLRMPAYEKHLDAGDVDALWAYVRWLRAQ